MSRKAAKLLEAAWKKRRIPISRPPISMHGPATARWTGSTVPRR